MFTVFAVGGKNDGLELGNFIDEDKRSDMYWYSCSR